MYSTKPSHYYDKSTKNSLSNKEVVYIHTKKTPQNPQKNMWYIKIPISMSDKGNYEHITNMWYNKDNNIDFLSYVSLLKRLLLIEREICIAQNQEHKLIKFNPVLENL